MAERTRSWVAAMFSRRWATDKVPGITTAVAKRCSSQASAVCCRVTPSQVATGMTTLGLQGEKPPSGKKDATAMFSGAAGATSASSSQLTAVGCFVAPFGGSQPLCSSRRGPSAPAAAEGPAGIGSERTRTDSGCRAAL